MYAENTGVPIERSRAEIEALLRKYGADKFSSGWNAEQAGVSFACRGKLVKFVLPFPDRNDQRIAQRRTRSGWTRRADAIAAKAYDRELRRRWRALALVIKAKLEAVESGITTFETEFMPHFVMPDGKTVAEHALPMIEQAYQTGKVPLMLPGCLDSS